MNLAGVDPKFLQVLVLGEGTAEVRAAEVAEPVAAHVEFAKPLVPSQTLTPEHTHARGPKVVTLEASD